MKILPLLVALGVVVLGCTGAPCDAPGLQSALDGASAGDVVTAGACRFEGDFTVPAGVTLEGVDGTVLVGSLALATGAGTTAVRSLRIEVAGGRALDVQGAGAAAASDLVLEVDGGVGVYADGVSALRVDRVVVHGSVDAARAATLADRATVADGATYAFVLLNAGAAGAPLELVELDADDVGPWGGLIANSHARWEGSTMAGVTGTGLLVDGGAVELVDVRVAELRRGAQILSPYGVASIGGATVTSQGLVVEDGEGVGVLHHGGEARHQALSVLRQARGGVRAQSDADVAIGGASSLADNGLVGLQCAGGRLAVDGLEVTGTSLASALIGETTRADVGDGVQLEDVRGAVAGLSLRQNARVGLLIDASSVAIGDLAIGAVTVEADGTALGAIAQDAAGPLAGWDAQVTRQGASAANDAAHTGLVPVIAPEDAPPPIAAVP